MSQKRHSCGLGTRVAGLSAASRRIKAPRSLMNWVCRTAHGYSYRPRRIDHFSRQLGVLVLQQCSGQGVHVDHDLHVVRPLLLASFDVDDQGVVVPDDYQVGSAGQRG